MKKLTLEIIKPLLADPDNIKIHDVSLAVIKLGVADLSDEADAIAKELIMDAIICRSIEGFLDGRFWVYKFTSQPNSQADKAPYSLKEILKPGDLITHTRCMGILAEHVFTRWDGYWICGTATSETVRCGGSKGESVDISPVSITHVNRVPIDCLDFHIIT